MSSTTTKQTYPVLSLIRMGGKDYEPGPGKTIDLTDDEFEALRPTGAIGIEPVASKKVGKT